MPLLQFQGVTKLYPGVRALDSVDLAISAGAVHGLIGENGAGKSTLLKVLAGAILPDEGSVLFEDQPVQFRTPRDALRQGITVIYQELALVPHLGADANVFLGMERTHRGVLSQREMRRATRDALHTLGLDIDPSTPVARLSVARQQLVELARSLVRNTRLIALDEPTATLTPHEVDHLFSQIDRLRQSGVGIIFVSHRLDEVRRIADTITVLRDGQHVWTGPATAKNDQELIRAMVGRDVEYQRQQATRDPDQDPVLRVRGLTREPWFRDISFSLRRGEIVGLAGLVGAGRSEVARTIAGVDPWGTGTAELNGAEFRPRSPRDAIERGVVYFSENRKRDGLVFSMVVRENVTLSVLDRMTVLGGFISSKREVSTAQAVVKDVDVRPPDIQRGIGTLSGGNQQKVVFAKGLLTNAAVLLFDEPTRGVDVGAKVELHRQIRNLANDGKAVLVVSSELPELLALADRVVVLREGDVMGELAGDQMTSERIMSLAVAA